MNTKANQESKSESTRTVSVILFKDSGKYYSEESWRVPYEPLDPSEMVNSPDYHRIGNGKVLITSEAHDHASKDQNWGYPHLI